MKNKELSDRQRKRWEKHVVINDEFRQFLDGIISADGSVYRGKFQSAISYTCKHKEMIDYIVDILQKNGVLVKVHENYNGYRDSHGDVHKFTSYTLRTSSYVEFNNFKSRWYLGLKKRIPKDLKVNKSLLLLWYLGDGKIRNSRHSCSLELGTYGFELHEVLNLAKKIARILKVFLNEIRVYKTKAGFVINLNPYATTRYLKYIGECPVDCYKYKWNISFYKKEQSNYLLKYRENE